MDKHSSPKGTIVGSNPIKDAKIPGAVAFIHMYIKADTTKFHAGILPHMEYYCHFNLKQDVVRWLSENEISYKFQPYCELVEGLGDPFKNTFIEIYDDSERLTFQLRWL